MNVISSILMFFAAAFRAIFLDGWRALPDLLNLFLAMLRRCAARLGLDHNRKKRDPARCSPIRRPEFKRPDPLIYSQSYLMSLGLAVTWDNPDITLEKATGPLQPNAPPDPSKTVASHDLKANTEYDVVARIWNGSTAAPVVDLPVRFRFFGFGIGTQGQPIGDAATDLGVKGGPGCPAFARVRWRTPKTAGHYCIQAFLDWFDDLNPANNLGQENTNVGIAQSPAKFAFRLRNQREERQPFRFVTDTYTIPVANPCRVVDRAREKAARDEKRQRNLDQRMPPVAGRPETFPPPDIPPHHAFGNHGVPAGWDIAITPASPVLAGGEEIDVKVEIIPPPGFTGRKSFNIHAFDAIGLAGGVTLHVDKA